MAMNLIRKLVRKIISEEIGRNYHTVTNDPYNFKSFQDYEILINPIGNQKYIASVTFKDNKIGSQATFSNYNEALHYSRMIIDKHRVTFMNKET